MISFDQLADSAATIGIERVFGIPGSGATLDLIDAFKKKSITFHLTRFEGSGVIMAATIGRLSGQAGLSLSIKGPGLANSIPGLATAWFESLPVIHLTEAFPDNSPAYQVHKRLDHSALVSSVTKGLRKIVNGELGLPEMAAWAKAEIPGPVVFELAESEIPQAPLQRTLPPSGDIEVLVDAVKRANRPIVVAGTLAERQGWEKILASLQVPVFSTAAAKGVIDEKLPCAAGVYTGVGDTLTPEAQLIPKADLIICLGLTAREVIASRSFSCPSVAVDAVETPGYEGFSFTARAGLSAAQPVFEALEGKSWGIEPLAGVLTHLRSYMEQDFLPGQVFHAVDERFNGYVRVVMDTGYFCTIGEHAWLARRPDLCLLSGQGRYMGVGLPMALGAALYDSAVPTIVFLGDGSIGMYLAEVTLAVRHRLPLLVILMTDGAFGSIRTRAIKYGLAQDHLIMDKRSWLSVFNSFGLPGTRAESLSEVIEALNCWNPDKGPAFLEVAFDPNLYEAMVKGIR